MLKRKLHLIIYSHIFQKLSPILNIFSDSRERDLLNAPLGSLGFKQDALMHWKNVRE